MLDAGPVIDYKRDRALKRVYELPFRGFGTPGVFRMSLKQASSTKIFWADEKKDPYTYDPYYWVRLARAMIALRHPPPSLLHLS